MALLCQVYTVHLSWRTSHHHSSTSRGISNPTSKDINHPRKRQALTRKVASSISIRLGLNSSTTSRKHSLHNSKSYRLNRNSLTPICLAFVRGATSHGFDELCWRSRGYYGRITRSAEQQAAQRSQQ